MADHIIGGDRISSTNPLSVSVAAGGGGAATIADGADVTQGALADAVVAAGAAGSLSAKLRRLTTDLSALLGLRTSATATLSNVNDQATSTTLLALNASRKGATIYNDSPSLLYVKLGATASATSFTVLLAGNGSGVGGYYEVPAGYTGVIDGIWSADASGAARVTELT